MLKMVLLLNTAILISACTTENGRPGAATQFFCNVRESACKQRCEPVRAQEAITCQNACEESGKDKCR